MANIKRNKSWHKKVYIAFEKGESIESMATRLEVKKKIILSSLIHRTPNITRETQMFASLGSKDSPYFTEEEALQEPQYSYDDLSKTEKEIYDRKKQQIRLW